jgi:pyruvate,orthophosphate dikinase
MGSFLMPYTENEIFKKNPFATLDTTGVGQLIQTAITKGRSTRPDIKLGICGEHGGDPDSVKFCHKVGLSYVSCSPFRVPVARLAAAQAAAGKNVRGSSSAGASAKQNNKATNNKRTNTMAKKAAKKAVKKAAKKAPAKKAAKKAVKKAAKKK